MAYDLAIVGSGFGGSLLAMIACRLGLSTLLVERGRHPRFAIGESTSPLTNLAIEELARRYELPRLLSLTQYGSWKKAYPAVTCGLKRGFTFYHHEQGQTYRSRLNRAGELLVAASPNDRVSDVHWLRSDVDQFLLGEAIAAGADYFDETVLDGFTQEDTLCIAGTRHGEPVAWSARLVIDASGPNGFLSRALPIPPEEFEQFPETEALFAHFTGVRRCDSMPDYASSDTPPYHPDDAALHHIFDGGWIWVLRFDNGVISAGAALTKTLARELALKPDAESWQRIIARYPSVAAQFERATPIRPFIQSSKLTYRASVAAGDRWALLPSAAAFIDPLFSTGMTLTLLGIQRLAAILERFRAGDSIAGSLAEYSSITLAEADITARLIGGSYAAMASCPHFAAFSMFYFAAASYAEMARRLDKPERATRFLGLDDPEFSSALTARAAELRDGAGDPEAFAARVARDISGRNIAGLADQSKSGWYGVDLQDLVENAPLLGFSASEVADILSTAPWALQ